MNLNPHIKDCLETTIFTLNIQDHPFFKALASGEMSKSEFLKTQVDFSHLVKFFNRPMALAVSTIPDALNRLAIIDNLWEEHGKGVPEKIHGKTILTLIERLGGDVAAIKESDCSNTVKIFNQALRGIAAFEDYRFSTSVFGGIERSFVDISTHICQAIVDNGWLPLDKITHYALHKEIDIQHAEDFLMVSNDDWNDPHYQKMIQEGISLGANLFLNVYTGFYHDFKSRKAH